MATNHRNRAKFLGVLALVASFSFSVIAAEPGSDADFDRLDGTGTSGKTVQVIEWEGNLELHVAPKGSLTGLGLKLDDRNKDRAVMVISYRFGQGQAPLIRRAILGVPFRVGFKAYLDPTEPDYDKIVISNQGLASPLIAYRLEAEPKQLYPDGHPALADSGSSTPTGDAHAGPTAGVPITTPAPNAPARRAASRKTAGISADAGQAGEAGQAATSAAGPGVDDAGAIKPYRW